MRFLFFTVILFTLSCRADFSSKGFFFHGIELEKSTFNDVFKIFGKNKKKRKGENATALTWVCFTSDEGVFIKFGSIPMVTDKYIVEISLISSGKLDDDVDKKRCSKTSKSNKNLKFSNGLGLGSKKSDVVEVLGKPKEKKDIIKILGKDAKEEMSLHHFHRKAKRKLGGSSEVALFDESLIIKVNYDSKNLVNKIVVYKITSY